MLSLLYGGLSISGEASASPLPHPVRFGISEFADYSVNLPAIPATADLLERVLGPENVEAKVYPVAELQRKAGECQVIFPKNLQKISHISRGFAPSA